MSSPALTHYWRIRARLPERFKQRCRVIVRGGMNSILIEFADGHRCITSRNFIRRIR